MPIHDTPIGNDPRFIEATVVCVDNVRFLCKVLTDFKQPLDGIPWSSEMHSAPSFGDRVRVDNVEGFFRISCILSKTGEPIDSSPNIDTDTEIDTGNYGTLGRGLVLNPEKPRDIVSGDQVFSNEMGGLFGLLKGGTFIARASKLAQVLISKYDDLVRVIARNYELFTDTCTDVVVSVRGRIYRFTGYADTLTNARGDVYKYREYFGDTVLGQSLGQSYYGQTPGSFSVLPAPDSIIRKYKIVSGSNTLFYQDLYYDTGRYFTQVQNSGATAYTYVDQTNATFDVKTLNGTYTRITTTPTSVVITYNNNQVVTIDNSKIKLDFSGNNIVTIDANQINLDFGGTTQGLFNSTLAQIKFVSGNNIAKVDSTGAFLQYNNGAHFVNVTTAGVTMG